MGSRSNSATSTTSNFYDQRQVNDAGGGVIGQGNTQDNRISVTDARTVTDAGSIQAAQAIAIAAIAAARDSSGTAVDGAVQVTERAIDASKYSSGRAFDLAEKSAVQSASSSGEALGLARNAIDATKGAYEAAASSATGNKTLLYVAIGAVALVGVVVAFRK